VREKLSTKAKLAAKRLASESTPQILKAFGLEDLDPDSHAVVLFTSGSEALPKGVPLTHRNILSDVAGIIDAFPLKREDVLLGFLPPFHSFGLTVCTILPLLCGLRVAYHPNPNESRKIAKGIPAWKATITAGTPTFLRSILRAAAPEQFTTLRALVSGAERAPQELFDQVKALPHPVEVLEGYGITECSPVVTMNRPGKPSCGVGPPLAGVMLKLVHPDTREDVPAGEQGLILVKGPTIFPGYLEKNIDPFIKVQQEKWYNTGDLGKLEGGSLVITGRLKRFVKIAGEMVSLGAVEDALQKHVPSLDGTPSVALLAEGTEGDARPMLVLFSSAQLQTERANEILKHEGFPHLVHISEVRKVKEIPVLGSGKTDYQGLKAMLSVG
jgi:long-chain-fatty-acid--[acyl-carrier-protein] ligase